MSGRRLWRLAVLLSVTGALSSCGGTTTPSSSPPAVTYSVTGTAKTITIGYTDPTSAVGAIIVIQTPMTLPFTYTSRTALSGASLYVSAQIATQGDQGSIRASISKDGVEVASQMATEFPNFANVSARY
jgi:hypothetical protein